MTTIIHEKEINFYVPH